MFSATWERSPAWLLPTLLRQVTTGGGEPVALQPICTSPPNPTSMYPEAGIGITDGGSADTDFELILEKGNSCPFPLLKVVLT